MVRVFDAARFRERLAVCGLSQSELARRVGVSQASIYRLASGEAYGSKYLHKIARELGTTPAYLAGETDDPNIGALPLPPAAPVSIMMAVTLPPEQALARMFEGLLEGIDREASLVEQARLLAQRLPIGLSQLRELRPVPATARRRERETAYAAPATHDREPTR